MNVLQASPNLLELRLRDAYDYEKLHFKDGWFPGLQRLVLLDLKGVTLMMIDKGAMPCLRELKIGPCPLLKEIPAGTEHLRNLMIRKPKQPSMKQRVCLLTRRRCLQFGALKLPRVVMFVFVISTAS